MGNKKEIVLIIKSIYYSVQLDYTRNIVYSYWTNKIYYMNFELPVKQNKKVKINEYFIDF